MDNCRECLQVGALEKRVEWLEGEVKELEIRLSAQEKSSAVSDEQIKMIFKILNEIKDSIKSIAEKIDTIEKKPAKRWDDVTKTVVTVAVTAVVTFFMSKILK